MLLYLSLHQFALVKEHELKVVDGFNVITGETGAGKSLLLDALSLCIGERADSSMVRHGAENADIYAEFDITDNQAVKNWFLAHDRLIEDNDILIRRQLTATGRSKAWLNGSPVSLSELKSLGTLLVNIHGQHAQQALLKPVFVIDWLDTMIGLTELAGNSKKAYLYFQKLTKTAKELAAKDSQRLDKITLLKSHLADIESLLTINYKEIEAEHEELSNLEALMEEAGLALNLLENDTDEPDISTLLGKAIKVCSNQASMSNTFEQIVEMLSLAQQQIDETTSMLADYSEQQLPDPQRLHELNDLMSLAHRLSRRHNISATDLVDTAKNWQIQLDQLNNQPTGGDLEKQIEQAWQDFIDLATELSSQRRQHAPKIAEQLIIRLQPLAMPNARCEFSFIRCENQQDFGVQGMDKIELLFSANVGMPMQPLHKIASGGELSRMALVMQVLQATHTDIATASPMLVFDEVDVGISGATAQVVGELLRQLGKQQQLLAITHQAQVASQAHQHILVHKHHEEQSESVLNVITDEEQINELARMSGGVNITEITRDHARSLLATVNN